MQSFIKRREILKFVRRSKVFEWKTANEWWYSRTHAPSAVYFEDKIRIYLGCWDKTQVSRIGYVDLDPADPTRIVEVCKRPVLEIGRPGTFDDNGVFPAHVAKIGKRVLLYYTGFQLCNKIPFYNFGGLAVSEDSGNTFERVSETPILDRSEEGLFTRGGQSILFEDGVYKTCYSAGSSFVSTGGKLRPTYDVYYQESPDGVEYEKKGRKIISHDSSKEFALGRPQIFKIKDKYFVFYAIRTLNGKYKMGCATLMDGTIWKREDDIIEISQKSGDFDSDAAYYPSVVYVQRFNRHYLFYCGNNNGETGIGYYELLD